MKKTFALLVLTTALTAPALALAKPVTFSVDLKRYGGDGAYLALYLTDPSGAYAGSLWVAGRKSKYYKHLEGWYRATSGNKREIDGITGASVGQGRSLEITLDLRDALFDAGYVLQIDASVEDKRDSPREIMLPLTAENSGIAVPGGRYINSARFDY
ncbi:DUF2271 domain-containing protein [Yoonia sp.]|uniref:DUF2271 domain-containing protein n=1 Tax=Yoonia sp. TaxID=2212373 RepID=UPI003F6B5ED0